MSAGDAIRRRFEKLEAEKSKLCASLDGLSDDALNRLPDRAVATWTIAQVMTHLTLSEGGTLRYIRKKTQDPKALPTAGLGTWLRVYALVAGVHSPLRFKAPEKLGDLPARVEGAAARKAWDDVRAEWRQWVETFPKELEGRCVFRHPFVGMLGPEQTFVFLEHHLWNHSRQIGRIRESLQV
jgi:hypothetical protein